VDTQDAVTPALESMCLLLVQFYNAIPAIRTLRDGVHKYFSFSYCISCPCNFTDCRHAVTSAFMGQVLTVSAHTKLSGYAMSSATANYTLVFPIVILHFVFLALRLKVLKPSGTICLNARYINECRRCFSSAVYSDSVFYYGYVASSFA
jgi:hypothetical protein